MPVEVFQMLDPEIVNPSEDNANQLEFWSRMFTWSSIHEMRLGPSTLATLVKHFEHPPEIVGLSKSDLFSILGKFSSRGIRRSENDRLVCDSHIRKQYVPALGDPNNINVLLDDLAALGPQGRIALGTDSSCWSDTETSGCTPCTESAISRVDSSEELDISTDLARTWRTAYLDQALGDLKQLVALASEMFPKIEFSTTAWDRLGSLSGSPVTIAESLVKHLGVLNDSVANIWINNLATGDREAALGSLGVTASLEGPRTHQNAAAMKTRDFNFSTGIVRCEWHTKLQPHIDRIHFAIEGERVLVGVIVDHLPV
jgi:hypothetical protein